MELSNVESSAFFDQRDVGLGYVISGSYAILSVGVLLTLSHHSRLEFQRQFEIETKTKGVLDRLSKMVAHNLRSPLATLQMQLEIDKLKGLDVERYEAALHTLIQTTEDMMSFDADASQMLSHELVKRWLIFQIECILSRWLLETSLCPMCVGYFMAFKILSGMRSSIHKVK